MQRLDSLVLAAIALILVPAVSHSTSPKLVAHLVPAATTNGCASGALTHCDQAVVRGLVATPGVGPFYDLYLLADRGDVPSIAGLELGIEYESNHTGDMNNHTGIDVLQWHYCADVQYPTPNNPRYNTNAWPQPHSGNLLTWNPDQHCQTGNITVIGYFYMAAYSPDVFRIVPRTVTQIAGIIDCAINQEVIFTASDMGFVTFSVGGNSGGCNPCANDCVAVTATQPTSWSNIKAALGRPH